MAGGGLGAAFDHSDIEGLEELLGFHAGAYTTLELHRQIDLRLQLQLHLQTMPMILQYGTSPVIR